MRRDQLIHTGDKNARRILGQIVSDPQAVIQHAADARKKRGDFRHPRLRIDLRLSFCLGLPAGARLVIGLVIRVVVVSCRHDDVTCWEPSAGRVADHPVTPSSLPTLSQNGPKSNKGPPGTRATPCQFIHLFR